MPDGTELNIPTGNSVTNPRIWGTKLSKTDLTFLSVQAWWSEFYRHFDFLDYMEYVSLVISGLFSPFALASCIISCKNRRKKGKKGVKQESKEDGKNRRRENRRLLARV